MLKHIFKWSLVAISVRIEWAIHSWWTIPNCS